MVINPRLYSLFEADLSPVDDLFRLRRSTEQNVRWIRVGTRAFDLKHAKHYYSDQLHGRPDRSLRVVNGKRARGEG